MDWSNEPPAGKHRIVSVNRRTLSIRHHDRVAYSPSESVRSPDVACPSSHFGTNGDLSVAQNFYATLACQWREATPCPSDAPINGPLVRPVPDRRRDRRRSNDRRRAAEKSQNVSGSTVLSRTPTNRRGRRECARLAGPVDNDFV